ncbi:unnamed protein product [Urochloa humidicola]
MDGDAASPLAGANYGVLPVDVLYDILLCLPAKELCRLRLVCQSWRSLTSDPLFAKAHLRSAHTPSLSTNAAGMSSTSWICATTPSSRRYAFCSKAPTCMQN